METQARLMFCDHIFDSLALDNLINRRLALRQSQEEALCWWDLVVIEANKNKKT